MFSVPLFIYLFFIYLLFSFFFNLIHLKIRIFVLKFRPKIRFKFFQKKIKIKWIQVRTTSVEKINEMNKKITRKWRHGATNSPPPPFPVSSQWRSISDLFLAADDVITHPLTVRSGRLFCVPHCVSTCYEPFFFGGWMNENSPSTWPIPSKASLFPLLWLFLCESNRSS